jgi:hypothetical protein
MLLGILEVENVDRFLRRLSKETITRSDEILCISPCQTTTELEDEDEFEDDYD